MIFSVIGTKVDIDFFNNENFKTKVDWLLSDGQKYADSEDNVIFEGWYIANLKILRIALKDFHGNVDYVKQLADNANEYATRADEIDFKGKGALVS